MQEKSDELAVSNTAFVTIYTENGVQSSMVALHVGGDPPFKCLHDKW